MGNQVYNTRYKYVQALGAIESWSSNDRTATLLLSARLKNYLVVVQGIVQNKEKDPFGGLSLIKENHVGEVLRAVIEYCANNKKSTAEYRDVVSHAVSIMECCFGAKPSILYGKNSLPKLMSTNDCALAALKNCVEGPNGNGKVSLLFSRVIAARNEEKRRVANQEFGVVLIDLKNVLTKITLRRQFDEALTTVKNSAVLKTGGAMNVALQVVNRKLSSLIVGLAVDSITTEDVGVLLGAVRENCEKLGKPSSVSDFNISLVTSIVRSVASTTPEAASGCVADLRKLLVFAGSAQTQKVVKDAIDRIKQTVPQNPGVRYVRPNLGNNKTLV